MRYVQIFLRILLGLALIYAGYAHFTFARTEFQALTPDWVPLSKDAVIIYSGVVEVVLGLALILAPRKFEPALGIIISLFFVAVFFGNLWQYQHHLNAFGLNTDKKRLIRLFFQPLLILWALISTRNYQKRDRSV